MQIPGRLALGRDVAPGKLHLRNGEAGGTRGFRQGNESQGAGGERSIHQSAAARAVAGEERLRTARASGLRGKRVDKADVDAAAAAVILERWFETRQTTS